MSSSKIMGLLAGISSPAVFYSLNSLKAKELVDCHECQMKRLPKAHELSLYDKEEDLCLEYDEKSKLPLLSELSVARQQLSGLSSHLIEFKEQVIHIYETAVAHSQSSFDYLKSEENKIPRILAIVSGGFVGLLFARKRGKIGKFMFTSAGTGLVFSAFYPALAKQYASCGWEYTKLHTSNALEKYGGYDTQKLVKESEEKIEQITTTLKSTLKLEGVTNQLKEWFDSNKEKVATSLNIKTNSNETKETAKEA